MTIESAVFALDDPFAEIQFKAKDEIEFHADRGHTFIGSRIEKTFDDTDYQGVIVGIYYDSKADNEVFAVYYTDGDREHMSYEEAKKHMEQYRRKHGTGYSSSKKKKATPKKTKQASLLNFFQTSPARKKQRLDPKENTENSKPNPKLSTGGKTKKATEKVEDSKPSPKRSSPRRTTASRKKRTTKAIDSEESSGEESEESEASVEDILESEDEELEDMDEDIKSPRRKSSRKAIVDSDDEVKKKRPAKRKPKASKSSSKAKAVTSNDDSEELGSTGSDDEMDVDTQEEQSESDKTSSKKKSKALLEALTNKRKGFKPKNIPQELPDHPFVDPVGVDPTHGIVERIIATQVRKVGGLLARAASRRAFENGELTFPIRLQTACSGTDAPSIALGLIQEALEAEGQSFFQFSHVMSCEITPFKQAYIGRNFPGVPLFPDITKLTASEEVLDVYGRPQRIPDGNLFIAGTSCKDFSMLKSKFRLDIEDKGTSGQTFLAAVEHLDQKQPAFAIFENVSGAPWEKMAEYITGRINLSRRNNTQDIVNPTGKKTVADADTHLKFSVDQNGLYVAEEVPPQVGIRAGSAIEGFVRNGDDSTNVRPLRATRPEGSILTLKDIARQHNIDVDRDLLVVQKKVRYCTHLVKLDTKQYGLPQTRNRKYLFIWKSDDPDDTLGIYLDAIMDDLTTPLLYSMDSFLLPENHDRIRCFREALRSGPGLLVKRERAKEQDFWDFDLSRNLDAPRHMVYREEYGIEEFSRWLTQWSPKAEVKLPPGCWPELFDCWNMRRLDLVDCFAASVARDAVSRDALHHSFTWDLSQNVDRTQFRNSTVGVSGCVTPGGELLLPHRGRSMMGYEKLLLQGIPFSRLLLGPETEVQLSDLAGNAMSVSVVSATILAALCAPELRRSKIEKDSEDFRVLLKEYSLAKAALNSRVKGAESKLKGKLLKVKSSIKPVIEQHRLSQDQDEILGSVLARRGDLYDNIPAEPSQSLEMILRQLAKDLSGEAFCSSVLCTCETSGATTNEPKFYACASCEMMICHSCIGRHQICSHILQEFGVGGVCRPDSHSFERRLRCEAPSALMLSKGWEESVKEAKGLESYSFQLQQIDRKMGFWELFYGAWEDFGSGRQVAEIQIRLGKIGSSQKGALASIRCFGPAIRKTDPQRGTLLDSARLAVDDSGHDSFWELRGDVNKLELQIVGSGQSPSFRKQIGITDVAARALNHAKPGKKYLPKKKSRNSATTYHKEWKHWPAKIKISGDTSDTVNGSYVRASCEHTIAFSALWEREQEPKYYIYIRPDVSRTGPDVAVIALTPNYRDRMEVCELVDWIPENSFDPMTHSTRARMLNWQVTSSLSVSVISPPLSMEEMPLESFHKSACARSWEDMESALCKISGLSSGLVDALAESNGIQMDNDASFELDLFGRLGTRNAKRLSIVAAPSLEKYAASGALPLTFLKWYDLPGQWKVKESEIHVPFRPTEKWDEPVKRGKETIYQRFYDPEESDNYYQMLSRRPAPFRVSVDRSRGILHISMNPSVAGHNAVARLGGEKGAAVKVAYSLAELSSMGEPGAREFKVPNSNAYTATQIDGLRYSLYNRQAKALTRMIEIEKGLVPFTEEERSEHTLPGIGWCLIGKASKETPLRGGVLGDAIGSGKTVVTIALIYQGIMEARRNCDPARGRSSASLIVVPPGLIQQWDDERRKFTGDELKCILIKSVESLKRISVSEMCSADIVIVPAGIIEEAPKSGSCRPYTEHLSKMAKAGPIPPAPRYYSQREAPTIEGTWIRNMASGPEIYVGNNGSQRKRDTQAYYAHCYHEAVSKLRERKFSPKDKGVPLEYFTYERVIIDECHETLVTGKNLEITDDNYNEKSRRGAREFLGVAQTDPSKRPLLAAKAIWGLTGTPLLETEARVTELANLMGGTYLTGACHHWRKEERESGRDQFLNHQEAIKSREYRRAVQQSCHSYVKEACQRNRGEDLNVTLTRRIKYANMSSDESSRFLGEIKSLDLASFSISVDQLGEKAGKVLPISASAKGRHVVLLESIDEILAAEPTTKIIVFANSAWGGYNSALTALQASGTKFCHLPDDASVDCQNEVISWFRHIDVTEEDRKRARVLLLDFQQAAGHNLQEASHNVIIFDPMYSGSDAVADCSVEEQAVGRVMRQGQMSDVTVTRIAIRGPNGERCLDDWIIDRNLNEDTLRAATSNFD